MFGYFLHFDYFLSYRFLILNYVKTDSVIFFRYVIWSFSGFVFSDVNNFICIQLVKLNLNTPNLTIIFNRFVFKINHLVFRRNSYNIALNLSLSMFRSTLIKSKFVDYTFNFSYSFQIVLCCFSSTFLQYFLPFVNLLSQFFISILENTYSIMKTK